MAPTIGPMNGSGMATTAPMAAAMAARLATGFSNIVAAPFILYYTHNTLSSRYKIVEGFSEALRPARGAGHGGIDQPGTRLRRSGIGRADAGAGRELGRRQFRLAQSRRTGGDWSAVGRRLRRPSGGPVPARTRAGRGN